MSAAPLITEELAELWKEARRSYLAEKVAKAAGPKDKDKQEPVLTPQALYANEENWVAGRVLALVHEETKSLLGNFTELLHRTVPGARRLVPISGVVSVAGIESVSGNWWLGSTEPPVARSITHQVRYATLSLHLDKLGFHSPLVKVIVALAFGGIARVELTEETQFATITGEAALLFLPIGTNILPVMSRECKLALRKEIEI